MADGIVRLRRETGRRFVVEGERVTTLRTADGDRLARALSAASAATPVRRPRRARRVAPEIEEVARYMVRGFHDRAAQGRYHLEPGFRDLVGSASKVVHVSYSAVRDDREDDVRRAFDRWQPLGFEFVEADEAVADIVVDDEHPGAWIERGFRFARRRTDSGLPVLHTGTREINLAKEWPEWSFEIAATHEIGHALGLGHPGPYNGSRPPAPDLPADDCRNTVMSYFGRPTGKIGPADRVAIDMIYDGEG